MNYILNSIKSRNALILCPNPRAYKTCFELIKIIKRVLTINKIPENIINIVPKELIRSDELINLFNLSDLNIVTGNQYFISKVKMSKKPFLIFGVGNPPIIIDKNIDKLKVAKAVIESKSFDYSTSCSSDSVLIIDKTIYENFFKELIKEKLYLLKKMKLKN